MPTQSRPSAPRAFAGHPGADTEGGSLDVLTHLDQPGISTARQEVSAAGPNVQGCALGVETPNDSNRGGPRPASQARSYTLICEEPSIVSLRHGEMGSRDRTATDRGRTGPLQRARLRQRHADRRMCRHHTPLVVPVRPGQARGSVRTGGAVAPSHGRGSAGR